MSHGGWSAMLPRRLLSAEISLHLINVSALSLVLLPLLEDIVCQESSLTLAWQHDDLFLDLGLHVFSHTHIDHHANQL